MSVHSQSVATDQNDYSSRSRFRILSIYFDFPYPPDNGARMRNFFTLKALFELGHEIKVISASAPKEAIYLSSEPFLKLSTEILDEIFPQATRSARTYFKRAASLAGPLPYSVVRFRSKLLKELIRDAVHHFKPDILLFDNTYTICNVPKTTIPVVLNHHNVEHVILDRFARMESNPLKRGYAKLESTKMKRWTIQTGQLAQYHLACSPTDAAELQSLGLRSVSVVPNVFQPSLNVITEAGVHEDRTLIYQGGMDWLPNRDALEYFVRDIFPLILRQCPEARLLIAGRDGPAEFRKKLENPPLITFTGTVKDMGDVIRRAAISVVPLRIGSGTRLKILEASSYGVPTVSTSIGAEGLCFENGSSILLADSPSAFANAVVGLLENAELRKRVGDSAKAVVQSNYSFDQLKHSLDRALKQIPCSGVKS